MNKLLILAKAAEDYFQLVVAEKLPQLDIVSASKPEKALALVSDCDVILGEPPLIVDVLASSGQLKWVQSSWAGVDRLCRPGLRQDYVLTGVKGIFGALLSEYVFTYLFALERHIFDMRSNQLQKRWQPRPYRRAQDLTLGIVGLGSVGQHLARTARCYGLRVIGLNRSGDPCDGVEEVYTGEAQQQFFSEADYIVVTLPDTPKTRLFINADVLAMMKPSATLINVGRGSVVNEADLFHALQQGQIAAAVLDVFETEPLPTDSLLWSLPNVFVTPHFAASSFPEDVVRAFTDNYARFLSGEPLLQQIDFDVGY